MEISRCGLMCFLCLIIVQCFCKAENCETLDGVWHSQIGSMITLFHTSVDVIQGSYLTAEERLNINITSHHSNITGTSPFGKPGAMFGFAVNFDGGDSTMIWTGQCKVCNGEENLLTSWLMRSRVKSCVDKWKSTLIGQDIFTRSEQVPLDKLRKKRDLDSHKRPDSIHYIRKKKRAFTPYMIDNCDSCAKIEPTCILNGFWYSSVGSELKISVHGGDSVIDGTYRTAVEREPCAAGSSHSRLYGVRNYTDTDSTMGFFVVWKGGSSITGWVGQCHMCRTTNETLETTWILREQVDTCGDNWKATIYGVSSFTRHEQKPGPREHLDTHTPGQNQGGEDDDAVCVGCVIRHCSALTYFIITVLVFLFVRF